MSAPLPINVRAAVIATVLSACRTAPAVFTSAPHPLDASFTLVPGVVVDRPHGFVAVADGAGGTDVVDLLSGALRWHTDAINTPLVGEDGALFGLAETMTAFASPEANRLHLVRVDAGSEVFTSTPVELAGNLVVGLSAQRLWITARSTWPSILVAVRGYEDIRGGFDGDSSPDNSPSAVTTGTIRFDALTGGVQAVRLDVDYARTEDRDRLARDPRWRSGQFDHRSAPYSISPERLTPWSSSRRRARAAMVRDPSS